MEAEALTSEVSIMIRTPRAASNAERRARHHNAVRNEEEHRISRMVKQDDLQQLLHGTTEEEKEAIMIAAGYMRPTDKHSHAWARRVLRDRCDTQAQYFFLLAMLRADQNDEAAIAAVFAKYRDALPYVLSKPEATMKHTNPDGSPIHGNIVVNVFTDIPEPVGPDEPHPLPGPEEALLIGTERSS